MLWLKEATTAFLVIFLAGTLFLVIYQWNKTTSEQMAATYNSEHPAGGLVNPVR